MIVSWTGSIPFLTIVAGRSCLIAFDSALHTDPATFASWNTYHVCVDEQLVREPAEDCVMSTLVVQAQKVTAYWQRSRNSTYFCRRTREAFKNGA